MTKQMNILAWILAAIIAAQAFAVSAYAQESSPPADDSMNTPLDDPNLPDPGDPDTFTSDEAQIDGASPMDPTDE